MTFIVIVNFLTVSTISILAHETVLDVDYDSCIALEEGDGINEMWYVLENGGLTYHLGHEVSTIKYYFAEQHFDTGCTWTPEGESSTVGEIIKTSYANSMKKWNNVYFYSYNSDGSINKKKIINIIAGTATDNNLTIYPTTGNSGIIASTTTWLYSDDLVPDPASSKHYHCADWIMEVNIDYFYENGSITAEIVDFVRERNGAHELGHMLGLLDADYSKICGSTLDDDHHYELLMGYGAELLDRSSDITYKDIAGVAITRGFHTDSDHKWLNMGLQNDGTYKLVCSICNGILSVTASELSEYSYLTYGSCNNEHELSDGNMMAVASYGNKDYYKCKYCRYVAPFSELVTQNYEKTCYSSYAHKCVNTVDGLEYSFNESHTLVDGECTKCTSHTYDSCEDASKLFHKRVCGCGEFILDSHYVYSHNVIPGTTYASCEGCGRILNLQTDHYEAIVSITQVSVNGSYILPNGIVVLVEEDVEAYLAGTLQFYHPEDVPVTQ